MSADVSQVAKEAVEKRFKAVSIERPINSILYKLALQSAAAIQECPDFAEGLDFFLPDFPDYLEARKKVSLLPLDTLKDRIKLPSAPGVILQLQKAIDKGASSRHIAQIIRYDLKLTAAVLSLVNSPLYGLPFKIETLERAVTVIGTKEISSLGLGVRILSMFEEAAPDKLPLKTFWKHSVACAVIAHDLALICAKSNPEKYLVAGLMHDMGRAIFFTNYPELSKAALALHLKNQMTLVKAELALFDVEHTMLGGVLFGEWKMPKNIINAALYHHDPQKCLGKEVPEIIYVANQIATALGIGCNRFYDMDPAEDIWKKLNLQEAELISLVENLDPRLWAIFCSLFPSAHECKI